MNKQDAMNFLTNNQPLPNDDELTEEVISKFDGIRKFFLANKDVDCIPLFLNSFGDGSGFGVYQLIENVIIQFHKNEVLPHLIQALDSPHRGVRSWCAEIASSFPDPILIHPLKKLLLEEDMDIRIMACLSLGAIGGDQVTEILENALKSEKNVDVIEVFEDVLAR